MVRVTDDAANFFLRMQAEQASAGTLRVVSDEGELVVGRTASMADDEIISHQGSPVLCVSAEAAGLLTGCTIGIEQRDGGPALQILPPEDES